MHTIIYKKVQNSAHVDMSGGSLQMLLLDVAFLTLISDYAMTRSREYQTTYCNSFTIVLF